MCGKRLEHTPSGKIRAALRLIWLRSRERAAALKNTNYCCSVCGIKQSAAKGREVKLDVHHLDGIDWDSVIEIVRKRILQTPDRLAPLCKDCHKKIEKKPKVEGKLEI